MKKLKIRYVLITVIFVFLFYTISVYCCLPENINISAGQKYLFNLNLPFNGEIQPKTADTIYINNKCLQESENVKINNNLVVEAHEGQANIKIKFAGMSLKDVNLNVNKPQKVYAVGKSVGIFVDTEGVLVLETGAVKAENGNYYEPAKNTIKAGDIIIKVNSISIRSKEDLKREINKNNINDITVLRNKEIMNFTVKSVKSKDDSENKLGLWVRDSTQGIGTITYLKKDTGRFGALGHPITDVDTGSIMEIKGGEVVESTIKENQKGIEGTPGALIGNVNFNNTIGSIDKNTVTGIYGYMNNNGINALNMTEYEVGYKSDIKKGDAYILANIDGNEVKKYAIKIDAINKFDRENGKNFIITITDKQLLDKTGGIVQGMSGCPIIQNNKLIGAVTHVFVNNPQKGYGIFIENMINN